SARPRGLLARASVASGEYQQDQGDRPLVQPELHPEDEGRQIDGNPGQPHADETAARVPEIVKGPEGPGTDAPERPALQLDGQPEPAQPLRGRDDAAADAMHAFQGRDDAGA